MLTHLKVHYWELGMISSYLAEIYNIELTVLFNYRNKMQILLRAHTMKSE